MHTRSTASYAIVLTNLMMLHANKHYTNHYNYVLVS